MSVFRHTLALLSPVGASTSRTSPHSSSKAIPFTVKTSAAARKSAPKSKKATSAKTVAKPSSSALSSSSSSAAASSSSSSTSSSSSSPSSSLSSSVTTISPQEPKGLVWSKLVSHLDPKSVPSLISPAPNRKTLYEHLSSLPFDGVGTRVRMVKWAARGVDVPFGAKFRGPIPDQRKRKQDGHLCYWEITKARIYWMGENKKPHGKAWGRLVWRGKAQTPEGKEVRIRGGLKHFWDAAR